MSIDPKELTLQGLLANRLFRIPHYQRAYSWQSEHRRDMFEDISKLKGKQDSFHFMSTVVGLRCEPEPVRILTDRYDIIEVVDGQQRLTTLVLLLKAIERKFACSQAAEERALAQELQKLLVKGDEERLILLQTNHDRSQYFANFLRSGKCSDVSQAQTLADRELLKAIVECQRFVDREEDCIDLLDIIKNQLKFIFHEIDDKAAVYTVFEVLNNRGRQVSSLDKLKNMLMAIAFEDNHQGGIGEHIDELHDIWGEIYRTIGLHQGLSTEGLRFGATLLSPSKISKPFSEARAVESLIEMTNAKTTGAIEVSNWLLEVTKAVNRFLEDRSYSREAVTKIAHARLLAIAIILRNFHLEEEKMLLDQWENTSFRIFGLCQKDARTGVGDYVRLAWDTLNNQELNADHILNRIRNLGERHSIDEALSHPEKRNFYEGWEDELRYLLYRYEEYLAEQRGQTFSPSLWNHVWEEQATESIEHILPQSKGSQEPLEANQEGIFVHRLGNLLLLPPDSNSGLGNKNPKDKVNAYIQTGLFCAAEVAQTIRKKGWGATQIEEREQKLLAWIRETWG